MLLSTFLAANPFILSSAQAGIDVYASPNDIQSAEDTGITGVTTETFETQPIGDMNTFASTTIDGTYATTSGFNYIAANDIYGGYQLGNRVNLTAPGSFTLTLNSPAEYLGFYFTAGDPNNNVDIYDGANLLLSFNTVSLMNLIPNDGFSTVTSINGSVYNTRDYYGQPVTGSNGSEPYAYLHFIATGGTNFNRIVFSQTTTATFDNDNHSIRATAPPIPGSLISVPEPASLASLGLALLALRRRRH